jgi:hypothetical protein
MISKFLMILLIFSGILMMSINLTKETNQCPREKVIYKYIPRTFEEEQAEPVYVSDVFKTMFTQDSPWVRSANTYDERKLEDIDTSLEDHAYDCVRYMLMSRPGVSVNLPNEVTNLLSYDYKKKSLGLEDEGETILEM